MGKLIRAEPREHKGERERERERGRPRVKRRNSGQRGIRQMMSCRWFQEEEATTWQPPSLHQQEKRTGKAAGWVCWKDACFLARWQSLDSRRRRLATPTSHLRGDPHLELPRTLTLRWERYRGRHIRPVPPRWPPNMARRDCEVRVYIC